MARGHSQTYCVQKECVDCHVLYIARSTVQVRCAECAKAHNRDMRRERERAKSIARRESGQASPVRYHPIISIPEARLQANIERVVQAAIAAGTCYTGYGLLASERH